MSRGGPNSSSSGGPGWRSNSGGGGGEDENDDEGGGTDKCTEFIRRLRNLKPYLEKCLEDIQKAGRALEKKEEVTEINLYLVIIDEINEETFHDAVMLQMCIDKIYDMARSPPILLKSSSSGAGGEGRSLEDSTDETTNEDRGRSPSPGPDPEEVEVTSSSAAVRSPSPTPEAEVAHQENEEVRGEWPSAASRSGSESLAPGQGHGRGDPYNADYGWGRGERGLNGQPSFCISRGGGLRRGRNQQQMGFRSMRGGGRGWKTDFRRAREYDEVERTNDLIQQLLALKPKLAKRQENIQKAGQTSELQVEMDDIDFYLEVIDNIFVDSSLGVDQLQSYVDRIHEILRKNPIIEEPDSSSLNWARDLGYADISPSSSMPKPGSSSSSTVANDVPQSSTHDVRQNEAEFRPTSSFGESSTQAGADGISDPWADRDYQTQTTTTFRSVRGGRRDAGYDEGYRQGFERGQSSGLNYSRLPDPDWLRDVYEDVYGYNEDSNGTSQPTGYYDYGRQQRDWREEEQRRRMSDDHDLARKIEAAQLIAKNFERRPSSETGRENHDLISHFDRLRRTGQGGSRTDAAPFPNGGRNDGRRDYLDEHSASFWPCPVNYPMPMPACAYPPPPASFPPAAPMHHPQQPPPPSYNNYGYMLPSHPSPHHAPIPGQYDHQYQQHPDPEPDYSATVEPEPSPEEIKRTTMAKALNCFKINKQQQRSHHHQRQRFNPRSSAGSELRGAPHKPNASESKSKQADRYQPRQQQESQIQINNKSTSVRDRIREQFEKGEMLRLGPKKHGASDEDLTATSTEVLATETETQASAPTKETIKKADEKNKAKSKSQKKSPTNQSRKEGKKPPKKKGSGSANSSAKDVMRKMDAAPFPPFKIPRNGNRPAQSGSKRGRDDGSDSATNSDYHEEGPAVSPVSDSDQRSSDDEEASTSAKSRPTPAESAANAKGMEFLKQFLRASGTPAEKKLLFDPVALNSILAKLTSAVPGANTSRTGKGTSSARPKPAAKRNKGHSSDENVQRAGRGRKKKHPSAVEPQKKKKKKAQRQTTSPPPGPSNAMEHAPPAKTTGKGKKRKATSALESSPKPTKRAKKAGPVTRAQAAQKKSHLAKSKKQTKEEAQQNQAQEAVAARNKKMTKLILRRALHSKRVASRDTVVHPGLGKIKLEADYVPVAKLEPEVVLTEIQEDQDDFPFGADTFPNPGSEENSDLKLVSRLDSDEPTRQLVIVTHETDLSLEGVPTPATSDLPEQQQQHLATTDPTASAVKMEPSYPIV